MAFNGISTALDLRLGIRRYLLQTLVASLCTNVFLAGSLLYRTPPVLTILVPPGVAPEDGWRFTADAPDPRYLERHALSLVTAFSTLSPKTMDATVARFLEHVDPEHLVEIEKRLTREITELKKDSASIVFMPSRTRATPKDLTVDILGERRQLIGSVVTSVRSVCYRLRFRHDAGRLFLTTLTELPEEEAHRIFRS